VTAYSGTSGRWLWQLAGTAPQSVDVISQRFYLTQGNSVIGVEPRHGTVSARLSGADGLYGERGGVAFGLDEGSDGSAWGENVTSQRISWTAGPAPWPHFFVDLGGIGGSADPDSDAVILATCAQVAGSARPELVVISR
jgi:hypothetical protein